MGGRLKKTILPLCFWLGVWALCATLVGKELILPSPRAVALRLCELVPTAGFWRSVGATLLRNGLGVLCGGLIGMVLGVVTAASKWGDALLSPALRAIRTVPVVSFILLLFFSLPTGQIPVVVAALMTLPVVWRSTGQGIAQADPQLLELAGTYRLSLGRKIRSVYLPAMVPALSAGWETGLGLGWKAGVAAEVLCQPKWGAGTQLQAAKTYLDAPGLFGWTLVIIALSLCMEALLRLALHTRKGGGEP